MNFDHPTIDTLELKVGSVDVALPPPGGNLVARIALNPFGSAGLVIVPVVLPAG